MSDKPLFFSHDCEAKNDIRLIELRLTTGWEGYGIFWAIIEDLAKAPDYEIEINKLSLLAYTYKVDISSLEKTYNELVRLQLLREKGEKFFSRSLKKRFEKLDEARKKQSAGGKKGMRKRYDNQEDKPPKLLSKVDSNPVITNLEGSYKSEPKVPITVEYSIVEDSIVKKNKKEKQAKENFIFDELVFEIDYPEFVKIPNFIFFFVSFLDFRREIGKSMTPTGVKLLMGKLKKFKADGDDVCECLHQSVDHKWESVYPSYEHKSRQAVVDREDQMVL
ncbi:DUF4373 domain-containing protein [Patescibacteria group bacterium]|nr:DUF4373 domain-containing protein [Patescibacteria group bacterium]